MPSHFEIFEIEPVRLDLDSVALEKKFHELVKKYHPDRNQNSIESVAKSVQVNNAYKVLKNFWSRLEYFFFFRGGAYSKTVPTELAELYFEVSEVDDEALQKDFARQIEEKIEALEVESRGWVESFDQDRPEATLESLERILTRKKYLFSMLDDLNRRQSSVDPLNE